MTDVLIEYSSRERYIYRRADRVMISALLLITIGETTFSIPRSKILIATCGSAQHDAGFRTLAEGARGHLHDPNARAFRRRWREEAATISA